MIAHGMPNRPEPAMAIEAWDAFPARVQQHIIHQLELPDALRAAGTSRGIYTHVQKDPRWATLAPVTSASGSAYQGAIKSISHAVYGPQTQAAVKRLLTTSPLCPLTQACADSEAYFTASLADWQQQEEGHDNHVTESVVRQMTEARREGAPGLSLAESPVCTLPQSLGQLTALEWLDLSGCTGLTALPESLGELHRLHTVHINGCTGLRALPENFGQLDKLQGLYMMGCTDLETLPETFGQLIKLERLDLSDCKTLSALPKNFGELAALRRLNLYNCRGLSALPRDFGRLAALQRLDLSYCKKLTSLTTNFGHLQALEWFDLPGCTALTTLPESFGQLSNLQELNLEDCVKVIDLPANFGNLLGLQHLNLCGGTVSLLPATAAQLQSRGCIIER